jgi:GMP synthase (glutamine-hydrolysing)
VLKTALALRHIHFEDLGIIKPLLETANYQVRYLDPGKDDVALNGIGQADLLIVLGGPIGAFDEEAYPFLRQELTIIRKRLAAQKPILGICLGAQLMARALGADVAPMGIKEIGFAPLTLSQEGESSILVPLAGVPVLHWHGDQFEIPATAVHLASTPACRNQAFSVGDYALGLQFHVEANLGNLERWLVGHACELATAKIDPCRLRAEAQQHGERLAKAAKQAMGDWLKQIENY